LNTTQAHSGAQAVSAPKPLPNKTTMTNALNAMFGPNDIVELRAFPKGANIVVAGYFDPEHRAALVEHAFDLNKAGALCYVTMNPIDPQLLGRYMNRIENRKVKTAQDKDVIRRRWLLLDFDPKRPNETAATDAQIDAARERCWACEAHLASLGWPAPIKCCSGNGFHLYYPIDLPNDPETTDLIKGVLATVAERFGTDAVEVDQTVSNAGRITKLCGTVATKGDHTPGMPWRLSQLLEVPDRDAVVTVEQLKALQPAHKGNGADTDDGGADFLDSFLARLAAAKNITCYSRDRHSGTDRYHLSACPFNSDHGRGKAVVMRLAGGALVFKCQESSCENRKWKDLRDLVDGPKHVASRSEAPGREDRVILARGDTLRVKPYRWLWDGFLARGHLHMLAGAPGAGKSTVATRMSATVTIGGQWPDGTKCDPGHVIVWSDEDNPEDTLLPRFLAAGGDPKRIHFVTGTANSDGVREFDPATDIPRLQAAAREVPECALVILDPVVTIVSGDSHKNVEVRRALRPLVGFAADLMIVVLGISHHTKGTAGRDPVERITGSVAFGALPRVTMAAARIREGDTERRIFCRSKSNIGPDDGGWEYGLDLTDVPGSPEVRVVVAQWGKVLTGSARDLLAEADAFSEPEERSALQAAKDWLQKLLKDGVVDSKEVKADANQAGVAWGTVLRAKPLVGVKSRKKDFGDGWWWEIPKHVDDDALRARARGGTEGLANLRETAPLKPSAGAGSTEVSQGAEKTPIKTPLKPSAGAGSTEVSQGVANLREHLGEGDHETEAGADDLTETDDPAVTMWAEDFNRRAAREPGYDKNASPRYCSVCANFAEDRRCLAWKELGARAGWKPKDKAPRRCRGFVRRPV
jgi:putative DNA primase/helicase